MRSVVVTGVSTGIGLATAKTLLDNGFRVFGSVRKEADAQRVSAELGTGFSPLLFDVTEAEAINKAAAEVGTALGRATLAGLVNNAGIAVPGPWLELSIDEVRRQFDVNVVGQLRVIQAFAPLLGTDSARAGKKGRIVMISSLSGRSAMPFLGPYSASKHAIEGLSELLRRELMLFGIDVIIMALGPIATPIWDKAEAVDMARFAGSPFAQPLQRLRDLMLDSGRKGLPAERAGKLIAAALTVKHPRARYTLTPGRLQHLAMSALPSRLADRMIARSLGLAPASRST